MRLRTLLAVSLLALVAGVAAKPKLGKYTGKQEARKSAFELDQLSESEIETLFDEWCLANEKTYDTPVQRDQAYVNWRKNLQAVKRLNNDLSNPGVFGLKHYSDLSDAQLAARYLMPAKNLRPRLGRGPLDNTQTARGGRKLAGKHGPPTSEPKQPPAFWDWRPIGVVPAIRNQKNCGSCWAFGELGALEIAANIKYYKNNIPLLDMSEQQLVDCIYYDRYGGLGCNGGNSGVVYQYLFPKSRSPAHVVRPESAYPYFNYDDDPYFRQRCQEGGRPLQGGLKVIGPVPYSGVPALTAYTATNMQLALTKGPLSFAMDIENSFFYWESGVYEALNNCQDVVGGHLMTLVGYNTTGDKPYWIVKNSWGVQCTEGTTGCSDGDVGLAGYWHIVMRNSSIGECAMYTEVLKPGEPCIVTAKGGCLPAK